MDDEQILNRGGTEEDIEIYSKENGADYCKACAIVFDNQNKIISNKEKHTCMPKINNITDLEQELFDTVYTWGRFGVVTDENSEIFKQLLNTVIKDKLIEVVGDIFMCRSCREKNRIVLDEYNLF